MRLTTSHKYKTNLANIINIRERKQLKEVQEKKYLKKLEALLRPSNDVKERR